jgi:hypothetical protein
MSQWQDDRGGNELDRLGNGGGISQDRNRIQDGSEKQNMLAGGHDVEAMFFDLCYLLWLPDISIDVKSYLNHGYCSEQRVAN